MLECLRQITQEVNLATDTQQALSIVVDRVCETLGIEVSSIYLADYQHQQLVLMATRGLNPKAAGVLQLNFNQGIVGLVAQREEPLNLDDAPAHPNFHYFPEAGEEPFYAFLGAPIIHRRKVIGVLVAQQKAPRQFSESEENFLVTLAAQLAGIIAESKNRDTLMAPLSQSHLVRKLDGFPAASGIAVGSAMVFYPPADLDGIPDKPAKSVAAEVKRIKRAFREAQNEIAAMKTRMENVLGAEELSLFDAYSNILDKNGLIKDVLKQIEQGQWAPGALRRAVDQHTRVFEAIEDPYFRERATDLRDLARRVLIYLEVDRTARPKLNKNAILVADEISAGMLAELPTDKILGIVSMRGSPTSHAAILAKALGIPAVCGFDNVPINRFEGQQLIIDGYQGTLFIAPDEPLTAFYQELAREEAKLVKNLEQEMALPAETTDGHRVPLLVNTGLIADFEKSLHIGSDGVGLYRTEIPFLLREQFPGEQEQIRIYRSVLEAFKDKSVTFRTLDIGGDKQLPYFPIVEDNPFLGWRGIRVTLDHPEIFLVQVKAILTAAIGRSDIKISLPMISCLDEVEQSRRLIEQALHEVRNNHPDDKVSMPEIGIVLEVPSAIYQLPHIAKHVDFICVGSNDLAQYLLAVDRNNTRVSSLYSNYHPAVLCALQQIRSICSEQNIPLNLCGEMAGDPMAALLLVGLGFDSLSMNARSLLKVKKVIRSFSREEAETITLMALSFPRPNEVYNLLFQEFEQRQLGGLIRAGR